MTVKKYFLGIDGGGTTTVGVVADSYGNILAQGKGNSINYHAIGMSKAISNFDCLVTELKKKSNVSCFDTIFIGSSALNREATRQEITEFTGHLKESDYVYMHSDVFIALMGLTFGKPGIIVVSGTGSVAAEFDIQGKFRTVGGWGYILGDEGSAYDISLTAIKAAIRGYEKTGPATGLIPLILKYFKIEGMDDLINLFYRQGVSRHEIAGLAEYIDVCAEAGDPVSISILKRAALDLAALALKFLNESCLPNPIIGIYGGVLKNSRLTRQFFVESIKKDVKGVQIRTPEFPPEIGAVFMCFSINHINFDDKVMANIRSTYVDVKERRSL